MTDHTRRYRALKLGAAIGLAGCVVTAAGGLAHKLDDEQGLAGGARSAGNTFRTAALSGQAPMLVTTDRGRAGGEVVIDGDLTVHGAKQVVEPHEDADKMIVYATLEGPEEEIYTRGTVSIVAGEAEIALPTHFAMEAENDGLTVTLTAIGKPLDLYVAEKSAQRILVREAEGLDGELDYFVLAQRRCPPGGCR